MQNSSSQRGTKACYFRDLGLIPYQEAYSFQQQSLYEVISGSKPVVYFCEHPPVLTMGKASDKRHLLIDEKDLMRRNIPIYRIDRGGEITLHSPGQLIVYPILNLRNLKKDLRNYLHLLEKTIILALQEINISSSSREGLRGVWVGKKKIASIGIGVKQWVSFHGFALNVNTDLSLFSLIRPCGLNVQMTSVQEIQGQVYPMDQMKEKVLKSFQRVFNIKEIYSH